MNSIREMFDKTKFEKLKDTDITQEVIQALDEISEQKKSRIEKGTGKIIRRTFETFAGGKHTCLRGLCQRRYWVLSLFVTQIISTVPEPPCRGGNFCRRSATYDPTIHVGPQCHRGNPLHQIRFTTDFVTDSTPSS